jgi:hypothetical protein
MCFDEDVHLTKRRKDNKTLPQPRAATSQNVQSPSPAAYSSQVNRKPLALSSLQIACSSLSHEADDPQHLEAKASKHQLTTSRQMACEDHASDDPQQLEIKHFKQQLTTSSHMACNDHARDDASQLENKTIKHQLSRQMACNNPITDEAHKPQAYATAVKTKPRPLASRKVPCNKPNEPCEAQDHSVDSSSKLDTQHELTITNVQTACSKIFQESKGPVQNSTQLECKHQPSKSRQEARNSISKERKTPLACAVKPGSKLQVSTGLQMVHVEQEKERKVLKEPLKRIKMQTRQTAAAHGESCAKPKKNVLKETPMPLTSPSPLVKQRRQITRLADDSCQQLIMSTSTEDVFSDHDDESEADGSDWEEAEYRRKRSAALRHAKLRKEAEKKQKREQGEDKQARALEKQHDKNKIKPTRKQQGEEQTRSGALGGSQADFHRDSLLHGEQHGHEGEIGEESTASCSVHDAGADFDVSSMEDYVHAETRTLEKMRDSTERYRHENDNHPIRKLGLRQDSMEQYRRDYIAKLGERHNDCMEMFGHEDVKGLVARQDFVVQYARDHVTKLGQRHESLDEYVHDEASRTEHVHTLEGYEHSESSKPREKRQCYFDIFETAKPVLKRPRANTDVSTLEESHAVLCQALETDKTVYVHADEDQHMYDIHMPGHHDRSDDYDLHVDCLEH